LKPCPKAIISSRPGPPEDLSLLVYDYVYTFLKRKQTVENDTGAELAQWITKFESNKLGGICSESSDVTVSSSTISSNAASGMPGPGYGGGIFHLNSNVLTVQNTSKIIKNLASNFGGGVYTGIYAWSSSPGSTVVGNIPDEIEYD
jgi:hypothetical protein